MLREDIAEHFSIARKEGDLRRYADGLVDANDIIECVLPKHKEEIIKLLYPDKKLAVLSDDQELPEIPEFQYDDDEYIPYLQRGAINYSKTLANFKRIVEEL